ncbi:MAG: T9SS type A sorting domain-containing protein [Candidatus Cloacimonetes bacterium]|nr:T9SS type A sorting domain-containing protein [Candidatus Cloacimonadota bacterium]
MKKGRFLFVLLLLMGGMLYSQSITMDYIGMHGSGGTDDFTANQGETIYVQFQYDTNLIEQVENVYATTSNVGKVFVYWYNNDDPASGSYLNASLVTISNFSVSGSGTGTDVTASFRFTLPTPSNGSTEGFQLMFGVYGFDSDWMDYYSTRRTSYITYSSYNPPSGSIPTGWQGYIDYEAVTTTCSITGAEVNVGAPLNGYDNGDWQPIAYARFITNYGTATLSSLTIDLSGNASSGDFQTEGLGIFYSTDATFTDGIDTQLDGGQDFASSITFSGLSQTFGTSYGYVFLCAKLSSDIAETQYLNINIDNSDVSMDVNKSFTGFTLNNKYLRPMIIGDFQSNYTVTGTDSPYYRLDLRTNAGTTGITSMTIGLSGTAVSGDFVPSSFKLWHSTSSTFSVTRATQLGNSTSYSSSIQWTGFTQTISSTESYFFFTASLSGTADPSHILLGQVDDSGIIAQGEYNTDGNKVTEVGTWPLGEHEEGSILPVELSYFGAVVTSLDDVEITWVTETETGVSGYYIHRSGTSDFEDAEMFNAMITPQDAEQVSTQRTYRFTDVEVYNNARYWYWLECLDIDGTTHFFGPVSVTLGDGGDDNPGIVTKTQLNSIYPNPFNPDTRVSFSVVGQSNVKISVYDVRGRLVRELTNRVYSEGPHHELWNGLDDNGKSVAGGVYFIRMISADYTAVKKALLLK